MNIVIIEDEAAAIRRLEKMILALRPEAQVLARLDSVEHAVQWFLEHKNEAELAFMDIQLADGASFEIFEHVEVPCPIIFTTAYDEFALQAFKVHAIDYLLKPIKHHELEAALDKFTSKYSTPKVNALIEALKGRQNSTQMQRILAKLGKCYPTCRHIRNCLLLYQG
ncbi:MAG: response regulator [Saprospiraceae bacterium]